MNRKILSAIGYALLLSIIPLSGCIGNEQPISLPPRPPAKAEPETFGDLLGDFNFTAYSGTPPLGENVYDYDHYLSYNHGFRLVLTPTHDMARDELVSKMESLGLEVRLQDFGSHQNILGFKWGEDRERALVLGAHYDTINTVHGANDNGGGCCAVLEIARALSGYNFSKTIVFALWDAEEIGLKGSAHFASNHKEFNISMSAYINFDCIGVNYPCKDVATGENLGLTVGTALGNVCADFNELARFAAVNVTGVAAELAKFPEAGSGSDHASFKSVCPILSFESETENTGWYTSFCNSPLDTFPTYEASAGGAEELKKGLDTIVQTGYYIVVVWADYYAYYEE